MIWIQISIVLCSVFSAIVLASPDIPILRRYIISEGLRNAIDTIEGGGRVERGDEGFEELRNFLEENVSRFPPDERECDVIFTRDSPFQNPMLRAGFADEDRPPGYGLVKLDILRIYVNNQRDRVRYIGLIGVVIGGFLQMILYF